MLDCQAVRTRRFCIAAIVAICIGGPIVEMFDQWDHTLLDENDTEADVVIVALCVGVALSVAGMIVARIRAMSSRRVERPLPSASIPRFTPPHFALLCPASQAGCIGGQDGAVISVRVLGFSA